jgi:hypothetical protein
MLFPLLAYLLYKTACTDRLRPAGSGAHGGGTWSFLESSWLACAIDLGLDIRAGVRRFGHDVTHGVAGH